MGPPTKARSPTLGARVYVRTFATNRPGSYTRAEGSNKCPVSRSLPDPPPFARPLDRYETLYGRGEIRTPETGVARLPVFKTGAFNRSATLPRPRRKAI